MQNSEDTASSKLQARLQSLTEPAPSEAFVQSVMKQITESPTRQQQSIWSLFQLPDWLSATACVIVLAISFSNTAPSDAFLMEALFLSEISDQNLFITLSEADEHETPDSFLNRFLTE